MENYILELSRTNNRVIIPDFGALVISQSDGVAVFNSFLTFDDGLIAKHISEREGIDITAAKSKIQTYVKNIKQKIDSGASVIIPGIGTFNKDNTGNVKFTQSGKITPASASTTNSITSEKKDDIIILDDKNKGNAKAADSATSEKISNEVKNNETLKAPVLDIEKDNTPDQKTAQQKPASTQTTNQQQTKSTEKPKYASSGRPQYVKKDQKANVKNQGRQPMARRGDTPNKKQRETDKKSNSGIIIFVVILAIVLLGGGAYFLFFHNGDKANTKTVDQIAIEQKAKAEALRQDSIRIAQSRQDSINAVRAQEEEAKNAAKTQINTGISQRYHVIAGCFDIENNAINHVEYLKQKGYPSTQYFRVGSMYFVSVDNGKVRNELLPIKRELSRLEKYQCWIFWKR